VTAAIAVDLDRVLGDTAPLWHAWTEDARRRYRVTLSENADEHELDAALGNWRPLLKRFAEEHAPVYLRPRPEANDALRRLQAEGVRVGAFTSAPEPLARVAAAQLGVTRRLDVLEAGPDALVRLCENLGPETTVARTLEDLLARAAA
jgi:phosphoglycolate phosphatase-like HAD superfamily hydrolase